jgi:hypothetical protein
MLCGLPRTTPERRILELLPLLQAKTRTLIRIQLSLRRYASRPPILALNRQSSTNDGEIWQVKHRANIANR